MSQSIVNADLKADISELTRLAGILADFGAAHGLPADTVGTLTLALEEVVANVILHGYGSNPNRTVRVRLSAAAGEVCAVVEDDAPAFDPLAQPPPNFEQAIHQRPVGGLGIHLVRELMDAVDYRREGSINRLTLTKRWTT